MSNKAGRTHNSEFQTAQPSGVNWLLVIAIDEYKHCAPLNNCVSDAQDVIKELTTKYNFEKVIELPNEKATSDNIIDKLEELSKQIKKDVDNLVIYFSGHGDTEGDAENQIGYLVPVQARKGKVHDYIPHSFFKDKLNLIPTRHTFVIIDACFSGSFFSSIRSNAEGSEQLPSRWGISSTKSREVALDGTPGDNSPFAKCLIETLKENTDRLSPHGLAANIEKKMEVRGVSQKPTCKPFLDHKKYNDGMFFFHPVQNEAHAWTTTQATDTAAAYYAFWQQHPDSPHAEEALWQYACRQNDVAAYQLYRQHYPRGKYRHEALDKLDDATFVNATTVPQLRNYLHIFGDDDANHADEAHEKMDALLSGIAFKAPAPKIIVPETLPPPFLREWIEPEMILVRGGTFQMGSNDHDSEKPIHDVTVKDFYIGKYPVTFAEYDAYCKATNREKPGDNGWGRERRPVINVSWNDATAYCKWLSEKTGKNYRLPSEAEWEFAATGGMNAHPRVEGWDGTGFKYAGSDNLNEVGWYWQNSEGKTHPVGMKEKNELNIHDMSGNVWEWCEDVWHDNYDGAPQDGSAWGGYQGIRVDRGGSWFVSPLNCRAAVRDGNLPTFRYDNLGFRLVRHL